MTSENSKFIRFYFSTSKGFEWIFLNLLLIALHFIWLFRRKTKLKNHLADMGIVAFCGIYGFIAIHLFQNKFFD